MTANRRNKAVVVLVELYSESKQGKQATITPHAHPSSYPRTLHVFHIVDPRPHTAIHRCRFARIVHEIAGGYLVDSCC